MCLQKLQAAVFFTIGHDGFWLCLIALFRSRCFYCRIVWSYIFSKSTCRLPCIWADVRFEKYIDVICLFSKEICVVLYRNCDNSCVYNCSTYDGVGEEMVKIKNKKEFHTYIRGIILLGFAMLLFKLLVTGNMEHFIAPKMIKFMYFAFISSLVLGCLQVWGSGEEEQKGLSLLSRSYITKIKK